MNNDSLELSIVIPLFNEQDILWDNAVFIAQNCDECVGPEKWRFVLVNNGSTDGTAQVIDQIKSQWPATVSVFEAEPNYGKALRAGLMAVETPWAHTIDVEYWDMPFLKWGWRHKDPYDLIIGSKRADPTLNQLGRYRRFLSWGLNALLQLFFEFSGSETHGPKFIKMKTMKPILEKCQLSRGQYDSEFVIRAIREGLWLAEAPIECREQRPQKRLMLEKIFLNIREFNRLRRLLKGQPHRDGVKMHRYARADVLGERPGIKTGPS